MCGSAFLTAWEERRSSEDPAALMRSVRPDLRRSARIGQDGSSTTRQARRRPLYYALQLGHQRNGRAGRTLTRTGGETLSVGLRVVKGALGSRRRWPAAQQAPQRAKCAWSARHGQQSNADGRFGITSHSSFFAKESERAHEKGKLATRRAIC
ncbi:hypothetical protein ERJ75_001569600 [Trypanosoma vivax]|nr:hypothetical protein ERJ75_001569600 [Trypanosoma vivax]